MLSRHLLITSLFSLLFHITLSGSEQEKYFYPLVHSTLWPNFCLQHLEQFPDACSAQNVDNEGNFYLDFLRWGHAEAYIDQETIHLLHDAAHLIPTTQRRSGATRA